MTRRWLNWLLAVGLVALLVWGCDRVLLKDWVGFTDLEVAFAVTDAHTDRLIARARVEIQSEGGFSEERGKQEFVLLADAGGVARKDCRSSMCFGTLSGLGFTNTYRVHLPWWRFRVYAPGYQTTEWVHLDVPQYGQEVERVGSGKAKLVVRVPLQKSP
jgi:hypothetical protein